MGGSCCPVCKERVIILAAKRKDSRGIVLNAGESQNAEGRYRYRYTDNEGAPHDVYSWRLRPEDPTPEGKKPGISLREMEKQIRKDLDDNLKAWQGNITVNELITEYIAEQRDYWAVGTLNGYEYSFEKHIKPKFGKKKVSKLTSDDIEKFYRSLIQNKDNPLKIGTVATLDKLLNPALQMAVRKNIIRINPADGVIGQVKKKCPDSLAKAKRALEEEQQSALLSFIKDDVIYQQYYPIFYLLAWTGCRINELLALTWQDIDFQNEIIYIRRSLSYKKVRGKFTFMLKDTKTKNGVREIPMLADTCQLLKEIKDFSGQGKIVAINPVTVSLDNQDLFIFRNSKGNVYDYSSIDYKLKCIVRKYNKEHAEPLPDVSCHTFRHNFCCWLCENIEGVNAAEDIKYIQSIMGHSDAATTLNIYSECRKNTQTNKHEALKKRALKTI